MNYRYQLTGIPFASSAGSSLPVGQRLDYANQVLPAGGNTPGYLDQSAVPNSPLAMHRHDHGRTIVTLKGGTLDVVDAAGTTLHKMVWEAGKAYWLDADPAGTRHGDLNRGAEPMEVIVVELKNDQKR
jgi:hypothetical protein